MQIDDLKWETQFWVVSPVTWDMQKSKAELQEYWAEVSALTIQDSNLNSALTFSSCHSLLLLRMKKATKEEQGLWKWWLDSSTPTFPYINKESLLTAILLNKIALWLSPCYSMSSQTFLRWWVISVMELSSCKAPSSETATKPSHGQPSCHWNADADQGSQSFATQIPKAEAPPLLGTQQSFPVLLPCFKHNTTNRAQKLEINCACLYLLKEPLNNNQEHSKQQAIKFSGKCWNYQYNKELKIHWHCTPIMGCNTFQQWPTHHPHLHMVQKSFNEAPTLDHRMVIMLREVECPI